MKSTNGSFWKMSTPLEKPTRDLLDGTSKLQWDGTSILQWDGRSTSTLFNGKPALGQELRVPSRLCQQMPGLEAGRAFLQGCKAMGDSFPLQVVFALDIFIDLFSRTAADSPHQPKAFPPLPRHKEILAPCARESGERQMDFFRRTFCTQCFCFRK